MIRQLVAITAFALFGTHALAQAPAPAKTASANPQVELDTTAGKIRIELYPDAAPKTVANFLDYVKSGHFNGLIFHRVIDGFMIQGGGYGPDYAQRPTKPPIPIDDIVRPCASVKCCAETRFFRRSAYRRVPSVVAIKLVSGGLGI